MKNLSVSEKKDELWFHYTHAMWPISAPPFGPVNSLANAFNGLTNNGTKTIVVYRNNPHDATIAISNGNVIARIGCSTKYFAKSWMSLAKGTFWMARSLIASTWFNVRLILLPNGIFSKTRSLIDGEPYATWNFENETFKKFTASAAN